MATQFQVITPDEYYHAGDTQYRTINDQMRLGTQWARNAADMMTRMRATWGPDTTGNDRWLFKGQDGGVWAVTKFGGSMWVTAPAGATSSELTRWLAENM